MSVCCRQGPLWAGVTACIHPGPQLCHVVDARPDAGRASHGVPCVFVVVSLCWPSSTVQLHAGLRCSVGASVSAAGAVLLTCLNLQKGWVWAWLGRYRYPTEEEHPPPRAWPMHGLGSLTLSTVSSKVGVLEGVAMPPQLTSTANLFGSATLIECAQCNRACLWPGTRMNGAPIFVLVSSGCHVAKRPPVRLDHLGDAVL